MVTISKYENEETRITNNGEYALLELRGLSTDEKPTTINGKVVDNGSKYIEIDTGSVYLYDLESQEWNEV